MKTSEGNSFPNNPIIVVGGGLAGLSAAHQAYLRGGNVVLIDKQGFLSGNSGKATSGINGALTRTQIELSIRDSVDQFYEDTLATAKDRANPELIKVLTYNSANAVHWLQEIFSLDLSVISRLGGHSQPRTHRGKDAKFPGMAITYKLLEKLESLNDTEPERVKILKKCQVIDLLKDSNNEHLVVGVKYKNLENKKKNELKGPVILATGGYAADFTKNSLLRKYRPDVYDLPSTNGSHATGDGQKIVLKNHGSAIDLDKVQVHPTGLIDINDEATIYGKKAPRFLFLGAEALRGEGGLIFNKYGERFVDELGTRDYVSGEIEKQVKAGNGPIRLVLNSSAEKKLQFHVKHYRSRNLMKAVKGTELLKEFDASKDHFVAQLEEYNKAAKGDSQDNFGKKFFPNTPFDYDENAEYYVSFINRVVHFTMGGARINDKSQVLYETPSNSFEPFKGLYAAGELAGGIHGHNRLGGSSLLACVVFGRLAADQASSYHFQQVLNSRSTTAANRLNQISLHIDPQNPGRVVVDWIDNNASNLPTADLNANQVNNDNGPTEKQSDKLLGLFTIPDKEFTEEEVAKHNKPEDCWCIIKNVIVDLTSFLDNHPGGRDSILNYAGRDATESFEMLHEDNFIEKYVKNSVLGRLKGKTPTLQ